MPVFTIPRLLRLLGRVLLAYILVFGIWIFAAERYHLLLGDVAARFIPLVVDSEVERVWYERDGLRFQITFYGTDPSFDLSPTQRIEVRLTSVVDAMQFGYPIITFLALAFGLPGPRWRTRAWKTVLGAAIILTFYALWIMVEVYQFKAAQELLFLKNNPIVRLFPPEVYSRYRVPLLVFLGQVLPISLCALLFFRPSRPARKRVSVSPNGQTRGPRRYPRRSGHRRR